MNDEITSKDIKSVDKQITLANKQVDKLLKTEANVVKTYRSILSTDPPKQIVKFHRYGKFDYIPITLVERLLDGLFDWWEVKIVREGHVLNGFYVVVELSAKIPFTDRILTADGIGFAEFQTAKGAAPTDFTQIMPSAGVLAVPKAKAEAIKNAAKSFGNLFGRNLARDDDQSDLEQELVNASRKRISKTLGENDGTD